MRHIYFLLFFTIASFTVQAQIDIGVKVVPENQVPEAVKTSQAAYFPNTAVSIWKQQTIGLKGKSGERYIAYFSVNGQQSSARYHKNGVGILAISNYSAGGNTSNALDSLVVNNYKGYTFVKGKQITLLPTAQVFYRLRLSDGKKKMTININEFGVEVSLRHLAGEGL